MVDIFKKFYPAFLRKRRPFKLTPAGWVFILYTIGVGAGAINTGNNLLYLVFGVFLGLILASGVLSDLSLWGLGTDVDVPEWIKEGETGFIPIRIKNEKQKFSSLSVFVELQGRLGEESITLKTHVPFIGPRETVTAYLTYVPLQRGWFEIESIRLTTRYPFGLLRKWWKVRNERKTEEGFFIYPKTIKLDNVTLENLGAVDDKSVLGSVRGDGSTIHGLREFRDSDNPRRIHWKASAKQGGLAGDEHSGWLIREMEKEQEIDVHLALPLPQEIKGMKTAEVEELVRFAASLVESSRHLGRRFHFLLEGDRSGEFQTVRRNPNPHDLNEWRFLSLWDPKSQPSGRVSSFLESFENGNFNWPLIFTADLLTSFRMRQTTTQ